MNHSKTFFKIIVPQEFNTLATRVQGVVARNKIKQLIQEHGMIELDFEDANLSPSFADEAIGILVQDIGIKCFKETVKLSNASKTSQSLIKHVISQRLQKR